MKIIIAKNAGFCFGVEKAVNLAETLAANGEGPIYTLGQIIHNSRVTERLEAKGVKVVGKPEDIEKPGKLIIRAHGAPPELIGSFDRANVEIYDATCPHVKKIHELAAKRSASGYEIVIIGDSRHPEVIGINGWCGGKAHIVNSPEEAAALAVKLPASSKLCIVAQTTLTEDFWKKVTEKLKEMFPSVELHKTICGATADRQKEAVEIASQSDAMIVIGEKNSSNACKLFDICNKYCPNAYMAGSAGELPLEKITRCDTVGITAGASVPVWVINEVIEKLRFFSEIK